MTLLLTYSLNVLTTYTQTAHTSYWTLIFNPHFFYFQSETNADKCDAENITWKQNN